VTTRRLRKGSSKSPSKRIRSANNGRRLDRMAKEAIDHCALILARCGYSTDEASQRFDRQCRQIPASVIARRLGASQYNDLAAHVVTLWMNERGYMLPNGDPRPLPPRGPAPSIEALVKIVGGDLTLPLAMSYLLSTNSLLRVGPGYLPRDQMVSHPGNSDSQQAHHMRALVDFLRTLDHNTRAVVSEEKWFQFAADILHLPASQLPALHAYYRKSATAFLKDKDNVLYRLAQGSKPGEPTVSISLGVYLSQGRLEQRQQKQRSKRNKSL
jgi:hypothetical protein